MTKKKTEEEEKEQFDKMLDSKQMDAWTKVCEALSGLPKERQARVIKASAVLLEIVL